MKCTFTLSCLFPSAKQCDSLAFVLVSCAAALQYRHSIRIYMFVYGCGMRQYVHFDNLYVRMGVLWMRVILSAMFITVCHIVPNRNKMFSFLCVSTKTSWFECFYCRYLVSSWNNIQYSEYTCPWKRWILLMKKIFEYSRKYHAMVSNKDGKDVTVPIFCLVPASYMYWTYSMRSASEAILS